MTGNRRIFALAVLLFGIVLPVFAQIGVGLTLNRRSYMQYEQIFACVTLRNDSGRPLIFGSRPELHGFVLFDIRDSQNRPVRAIKDKEVSVTGLYLAPGEVKSMVIPLGEHYDLSKPGNYRVHAYVGHNVLPNEFRSQDKSFSISQGVEVWRKTVGKPEVQSKQNREKSAYDEITYSIRVASDGGFRSYYLRVEDEKYIHAVMLIGHEVSYEKFQVEVDMLSRIHLLMPVSPRVFHYMSFNVNGINLANSYWKTSGTIPILYRDQKTGSVTRMGGIEARKGIDYRDPREGRLSINDMITPQDQPKIAPPVDEGVVDLGEHTMPQKAPDEK